MDEIFDRKSKIILGTMLSLIGLLLFSLSQFGYFENQRRDEILNQNYKAKVIEKFEDKSNRNARMIRLSNSRKLFDYWPKNVELKIGDSIIKEKMSTNLLVKRNSRLIYSLNLLEAKDN
ncbi:hypothetical protein KIH23_13570 [Flavobacterium sp. CYK-55]|uniref:hypothetical protein n=1 Tax=Flavobacterium sp. CYK-55 TaxID=2835529 RepID=UPI001BCADD66|nr:hypothetical protein [Flavobacterium sp. CYK-55]MBS7788330.1 hypothetical protein [Flavobacterium sp. CYK-55]